jgi:hypothetical protein
MSVTDVRAGLPAGWPAIGAMLVLGGVAALLLHRAARRH